MREADVGRMETPWLDDPPKADAMPDEPITFLDRARESYQTAIDSYADHDQSSCREELQFATTAALVSIAESLAVLVAQQKLEREPSRPKSKEVELD